MLCEICLDYKGIEWIDGYFMCEQCCNEHDRDREPEVD